MGGLYYWEGGELHGTVDYLCGNGKAYFNNVKLVNEQRSSSTITANSELYVFNNCPNFIRTIPSLVYDTNRVEDIDTRQEDHAYDMMRRWLTGLEVERFC